MGRFDALTQIEEKPITPTPSLVTQSPTPKQTQTQHPKKQNDGEIKKPEIMKSRIHENSPAFNNFIVKPEKYSTLLNTDLAKKLKLYAAEREIKSYEVLEIALKEFFEKHK